MEKTAAYAAAKEELAQRIAGETDLIANLANASAILNQYMTEINWVGFYLYKENQLVLGPFQGRAACVRIALGSGVCGTAFQQGQPLLVPDVHQFPGHIACDSRSQSEIVLPFQIGPARGVLDIDSPVLCRFDMQDLCGLQAFLSILERSVR